jgi:hypothetical protein
MNTIATSRYETDSYFPVGDVVTLLGMSIDMDFHIDFGDIDIELFYWCRYF